MYKLYVMKGALVWDIDKFIEENLKDSLKKFNISHEIMKLVIENEPFLIVSNYGSFTKAEIYPLPARSNIGKTQKSNPNFGNFQ